MDLLAPLVAVGLLVWWREAHVRRRNHVDRNDPMYSRPDRMPD